MGTKTPKSATSVRGRETEGEKWSGVGGVRKGEDSGVVGDEDAPKMWKDLGDREAGKLRPYSFSNRITSHRIASLQLSNFKEIVSPHRGAINSLQVPSLFSLSLISFLAPELGLSSD